MAIIYDPLGNSPGNDTPGTGGDAREARGTAGTDTNKPPPTAAAAPKGSSSATSYVGLCDALNAWQQDLVKTGTYSIADQYEIVFVPENIRDAKLKKAGTTNQSATAMQQATTAKAAKDPATNTMGNTTRATAITAGMQIIQFIDQVVRGSTYITDQQKVVIDETTGKTQPNANNTDGQVAWYKISITSTQLGWDAKRNDFAYRMQFIVSPYAINEAPSEYFPKTAFRGVHKSYQYWFTGQNTSVLNYEQAINNLYTLTISDTLDKTNSAETDPTALYRRSWGTRSEQSDQGAKGKTNEAAANLADGLYSQQDFIDAKLEIVGDPAWIPQGEVSGGLTPATFSFAPFLSDGTINVDASEATFSVSFNWPSDYDFDTGIISNKNAQSNQSQNLVNGVYKATECISTFARGRFTQNIKGVLITNIPKEKPPAETRPPAVAKPALPVRPGFGNTGGGAAVGNPRITAQGLRAGATQQNPEVAAQLVDQSIAPVGPAAPPKPATSNGEVAPQTTAQAVATTVGTGTTNTSANLLNAPPLASQATAADAQIMRQLQQEQNTLLNYTTDANGNPRQINPGSLLARRVANQEQVVADLRAKLSTVKSGVNSNPQIISKDQ